MKCLKCSLVAVAVLAMFAATVQNAAAVNLLSNPGFETPFVDGSTGVGEWNPFAGGTDNTSAQGTTMPRSGLGEADLHLLSDGGFAGFYQDVSVVPGTTVDWSVWAKDMLGGNGQSIEMRIEYRDDVGEIARTANLVPASLGSEYELIKLTDVVPAGANIGRAVLAIQSFGVASPQSIFVDDAVFTPEPASIVMMGIAGLAMATMRRRQS